MNSENDTKREQNIPPDRTALTMMPSGEDEKRHPTEVTMPGVPPPETEPERTMVMSSEPVRKTAASAANGFLPGDRIDRYIIVKKLGQGGMGSVYLARHETLGVFRAVKVLSGALYIRGGEFIRRFIQEAKNFLLHPCMDECIITSRGLGTVIGDSVGHDS